MTITGPLERLGEYLLVKRIAAGGMAEVFRAQIRGLGGFRRDVAIKRILPEHAQDTDFITMMLDEARISARLVHPNIVQVLNCGCIDGNYFIAMEYVDGPSLSNLSKRLRATNRSPAVAPYPLQATLYIGVQLLRGLAAAHEFVDESGQLANVVHRDVSPQNVLLSSRGEVKLSDFGIARAAGKLHQTSPGLLRGKLAYMAPEQLTSKIIDHRVDQFAAGLVILELLLGEAAYPGESASELIKLVTDAQIPDLEGRLARLNVPDPLQRVVRKSLSRNPDHRFPSCAAFALELGSLQLDSVGAPFGQDSFAAFLRQAWAPDLERSRAEMADFEKRMAILDQDHENPTTDLGPKPQGEPPARRPWAWIIGAAIVVVSLSAAGLLWLQGPARVVRIVTVPAGAQIQLDGEALGRSPTAALRIEPGREVTVTAQLAGYEEYTARHRLEAGQDRLDLELVPRPATLEVTGARAGSEVKVAGKSVGKADGQGRLRALVPPGPSQLVRIERSGQRAHEVTIDLAPGQLVALNAPTGTAAAAAAPRKAPSNGALDLICLPWCRITIDGALIPEQSPLRDYVLAAGQHRVEVDNPNTGSRDTKTITIREKETTRLSFRLGQ
jgi:serine/threonine protein kinase